jgi:hypothetical protein
MILSLFGATAPGGFVLGATFSGIFAQLLWWPWASWVMGIVLFAAAGLAMVIVPKMPVVGGRPKVAELDPFGSTLGGIGLVLVNFAWNQEPVTGWQTVHVYVLLIVGVVVLGAFL